jgi:hypothetical protein
MLRWTRALGAAAVLAAAALLIGCEDTPLTPGEDWTIDVVAQPSVVTLSAGEATSTLIATVANDTGVPQSGVSVIFSNAGGTLSSGSEGVETDGAGRAVDTLTISDSDPDEIEVTVVAGALSDTVTITKSTGEGNRAPTAVIQAVPAGEQVAGQSVIFDGSGSSDPDEGDVITVYRWRITSDNPDDGVNNPRVFEAAGLESIGFPGAGADGAAFTKFPQNLNVELSVTDDPLAPIKLAREQPVIYRTTVTTPYKIVDVRCAPNTKPVARIAGGPFNLSGGGQASVTITLNGSLSSDAEGDIALYTWTCGSGGTLPPSQPTATCTYPVANTSKTFTATLVVTDEGLPAAGQCPARPAEQSTQTSVLVTVSP